MHSIALAIPLDELAPAGDEDGFFAASTRANPRTPRCLPRGHRRAAAQGACSAPRYAGTRFCPEGTLEAGPWRHSRIGLALINEVVIGVQDKDKYNRTTPADDIATSALTSLNPILVRDVEAIGYAQLGVSPVPDDLKFGRVDILDVVNLNVVPVPGVRTTSRSRTARPATCCASTWPSTLPSPTGVR